MRAYSQTFTLTHTFENPTIEEYAWFGDGVALDGNRIVIGAGNVDLAYLFDAATGSVVDTFHEPGLQVSSDFGDAVALDGDRILIGSRFANDGVGQAHLFDATTGDLIWTFDDPTASDRDWFGNSVALDGNRVLIGADRDDTNGENVGQAHLFDATTGNLLHTFDDPIPTGGDRFGLSMALDGNHILIGGGKVGQAHLFDATTGSLLGTFGDPTSTGDNFGGWVALEGHRALIGAFEVFADDRTSNGQAHLFDIKTGDLLRTFDDPNPTIGDIRRFGRAVALSGDQVLISAPEESGPGQVHFFSASTGNLLWTFDDPTPTRGDYFGVRLALDENRVLIGAPRHDINSIENVGEAHLFVLDPAPDFNYDGRIDTADIDRLVMEIVSGTNNASFDLTGDGIVDSADQDHWLTEAANQNGFAASYLVGDANLDGTVDAADLNALGQNWLGQPNSWSSGDFNADGTVDANDLNKLGQNWLASTPLATPSVPEPTAWSLLACSLAWFVLRQR